MKKLVKLLICSCIALAGCIATVQAQDLAITDNQFTNTNLLNAALATENTGPKIPAANVNAKALGAFNKEYKNAENIQWFKSGDVYLAMFNQAGVQTHVMYG